MNARFAEMCRVNALLPDDIEADIILRSVRDGRSPKDALLIRQQDIFFGGTNNNKYRDNTGLSQSNVARLYEVYSRTPAAQKPPKFRGAFRETYPLNSFIGKLLSKLPSNEDGRFDPTFHAQREMDNSRSQFS